MKSSMTRSINSLSIPIREIRNKRKRFFLHQWNFVEKSFLCQLLILNYFKKHSQVKNKLKFLKLWPKRLPLIMWNLTSKEKDKIVGIVALSSMIQSKIINWLRRKIYQTILKNWCYFALKNLTPTRTVTHLFACVKEFTLLEKISRRTDKTIIFCIANFINFPKNILVLD